MTGPRASRVEIRLGDPAALTELLGKVRTDVDGVDGVVVTSRDGLVLAADLNVSTARAGEVASQVAAMASVSAGVGLRFVQSSELGRLQGVLMEGDRGCIGVHPLSATVLLVLLGTPGTAMGRFTVAAKRATAMLLAPDMA
ncbi:roadblock/LC7 domain-containing protein [Umezawaea sp. Da 62-37]|uniref:roadblock/LC7 domain-containing protein n=1 Tax=Umezawaea sp. Da 62-37 TaxID=3075927 RepID=UPI0028F739B6|nr:roadblock/LC7 domain-containing protein [Umezawaea sp. Da 62-37]WNV86952.1 roadblock/LC7 domain-containing protein [Umezawaea sp. Da 62-37]